MIETISREEFVRQVSESGVLSRADLRTSIDELGDETNVLDAVSLSRNLVRSGRLTPFQSEAILSGRLSDLCIGNYIVLDRLGAGGMGTVFKARHRRMKRVVALKVLSRETAGQSNFAQRFQREVETIAQFSHPNIVMAFDADEAENGLFLVMEFVDGSDLGHEVMNGGRLATRDAVDCILQAARGLAYAHDHGVVHRDVKPANLLRDKSGVVKVADLGLAQLSTSETSSAHGSLTQAGSILGTADYMAPEQALDPTAVDHRVDVYSLGCTLYFLLTGRPPYSAGSLMALLLKHRDAPIASLRAARPDVPTELDQLYRRMTSKRPEDRHPTMADVVQALEAAIGSMTLSNERPGKQAAAPMDDPNFVGTVAIGPISGSGDASQPLDVCNVADLTVVLVEPSRAQASIVRKYLRELGIENVHATDSGRLAIQLAKETGADVILSAMHLADMTGLRLAQALHADSGCTRVGFVLASSDSDGGESSELIDAPLTVLLQKPFDCYRLARSLAHATGRRA